MKASGLKLRDWWDWIRVLKNEKSVTATGYGELSLCVCKFQKEWTGFRGFYSSHTQTVCVQKHSRLLSTALADVSYINVTPTSGLSPNANFGLPFILSARPPVSDPGPKAAVQRSQGTGDRLASHDTYQQHGAPQGEQGPGGHVARRSLQVDVGSSRTGRSPSVSPDRGSVPTSPYSVPQIAPMPSSKLCPVCKTTDLMGAGDDKPNFNTCTQCCCKVCNQCGFNPNPHLSEVGRAAHLTGEHLFPHYREMLLFSAPALCNLPNNQPNT